MRTVYKYPLLILDEQEVELPFGAHILTVDVQRGEPCLWALVESTEHKTPRKVLIGQQHPHAPAIKWLVG